MSATAGLAMAVLFEHSSRGRTIAARRGPADSPFVKARVARATVHSTQFGVSQEVAEAAGSKCALSEWRTIRPERPHSGDGTLRAETTSEAHGFKQSSIEGVHTSLLPSDAMCSRRSTSVQSFRNERDLSYANARSKRELKAA